MPDHSLSTATTWALFALSQSPESQIKLQDELLQVDRLGSSLPASHDSSSGSGSDALMD